jgi:hypothetical protein
MRDARTRNLTALLAGMTGAFALFPTAQLGAYANRTPVQTRVYANFARVGQLLRTSMRKVGHESQAQTQHD